MSKKGGMGNLKLVLENIGGLVGRHQYTLKEGLNLISAPNASGKSSVIHGLQALIMESKDLEKKSYFLNAFERSGRAELSWNHSRSVRRIIGGNAAISVGGEPIHPEEKKCTLFAIASEDNDLLVRLKSGRPIRNLLLEFSDYRYYQHLRRYLESEQQRAQEELGKHQDTLAQLKSFYSELKEKKEDLAKREEERSELADVSMDAIAENKKLTVTLSSLDFDLSQLISEIAHIHGEYQRLKNRISNSEAQERRMRTDVTQFEREHPDIERDLEELEQSLAELKDQMAKTEARASVVTDSLEKTNSGLVHYMEYGQDACPTCGQHITPELLRERQKKLEEERREIRESLTQLQDKHAKTGKNHNTLSHYAIKVKTELRQKLLSGVEQIVTDRKKVDTLEKKLDTKVKKRKQLVEKVRELEASVDRQLRNLLNRRRVLDEEIARLDENIKTIKAQIDNLGDVRSIVDYLVDENAFLDQALEYVSQKEEEVQQVVRKRFNEQIVQVYSLMEFDEVFDKIFLDEEFNLQIIRRHKGLTTQDSYESLSRGEKETVGLILMLAGNQEHLPDFPFFIADETSFYDATRFRRIVDFITNRVAYTVVTNLVPKEEQTGLKLQYSFS